ncbi:GNAT family N-acetyltransferase [Nocardioides sp. WV_118_6]|uniref:GNAT family N-acetyltransferase n=1 Tax=Nocardioides simplex TaxID=2045 RepID=UPI00214F73F3|nr:GNAT family N-acetyltransferase [Pimelobacter simplex]UUW88141.1 GNAT family N-acetyltransferase [Pimelobacter simplex]UUW97645.1 GNAT family N-acetyltransferase [Pimelobacter simplex]
MQIATDDPRRPDVLALLDEHLADMYATSPAESVHALDPDALAAPEITFWTARDPEAGDLLLGCAALKRIDAGHAELKSMRTATVARRRGVAGRLLDHVLDAARANGHHRVSLETGTEDYFAPARALYVTRGFTVCGPFEGYSPDPNSTFLTLDLSGR